MKNIYLLAVAAIILSLGSCTIEKRHYQSGYHVEWNHRNKGIDKAEEVKVTQPEQEAIAQNETSEITPETGVSQPAEVAATVVIAQEESTASMDQQPVFESRSATQKLTTRAEAHNTAEISAAPENRVNANNANTSNNAGKSRQVDDIVIAILCIFIPPLAVFLYESDISTNFWVDLILTCLFWLPGIIFAFLVCFAGVSL